MDISTKGQNLLGFSDRSKTNGDRKEYLALIKAKSGYKCTRYNHAVCQTRKDFAGQCNICGHIESATADTLFHKVRFGVGKASFIRFGMATTTNRS